MVLVDRRCLGSNVSLAEMTKRPPPTHNSHGSNQINGHCKYNSDIAKSKIILNN